MPHRRVAPARPHAPQHTVNFAGSAAPGELVDVLIESATSTTLRGAQEALVPAVAALRCGPAHRLVRADRHQPRAAAAPDGHGSSGSTSAQHLDGRVRRYLIQDLAGQYPGLPGRDRRRPVPGVDSSSTWRRTPRCTSSCAHPHRALENTMMTFNVLEYCRQRRLPLVFSSTREVYGDVHRFEELRGRDGRLRLHREPVLRLEDRLRGVHLRLRALLRAQVPRVPLLERLRALRQRPAADVARAAALHPLDVAATSRSRSTAATTRCSTSPTSTTASTGSSRGIEGLVDGARRERDDQPGVRRGQHARSRRRADRGRARRRAEDHDRAVAASAR